MSKKRLNDNLLVMETNNSSIVSKRSVERLYYPDEPHFFRFFVRKFQRRSPLINRGYLLRLKLVDTVVRRFLSAESSWNKVVVNLGCGSDVLPWQCLTRYPKQCENAVFVDVDFPDLILRKTAVVSQTDELASMLTNLEVTAELPCPLRSDKYAQVGCDLRDLGALEKALLSICDPNQSTMLFVAEVSITYMETPAADAVIEWASRMGHTAEFCLLEQILPDGEDHPFAKTMINHFNKLKTPIKSVAVYPTIDAQRARFYARGWPRVQTWSLWDAWGSPEFFSAGDRAALDKVEPFDEWEEFALFGSHYLLLHATSTADGPSPALHAQENTYEAIPSAPSAFTCCPVKGPKGHRRFAAGFVAYDILGQEAFINFQGLGTSSRLQSFDNFRRNGAFCCTLALPVDSPPSRMCHTIVDLGDFGIMLAGGRTSPSAALADCWLLRRGGSSWERLSDLPSPLYRHSVSRLGKSSLCLLAGGKTGASSIYCDYLVFHPLGGWIKCSVHGHRPLPTFGNVLYCSGPVPSPSPRFRGLLCGGMLEDGTISQQVVRWELTIDNAREPLIYFEKCLPLSRGFPLNLVSRFGAAAILYQDHLLLLGGIIHKDLLPQSHDILLLSLSLEGYRVVSRVQYPSEIPQRPLLVGSSVSAVGDKVLIAGGGATCFSMGTFWTAVVFTMSLGPSPSGEMSGWGYSSTVELVPKLGAPGSILEAEKHAASKPRAIRRVSIDNVVTFRDLVAAGKPVIIEGLDIGNCVSLWTPKYLATSVGEGRKVVVHQASTETMDFNAKNFTYVTKDFGSFMSEVKTGAKMYMRALSKDNPTGKPTIFSDDFPEISSDFTVPPELEAVNQKLFSSVLRISGKANMWLHFDVMANAYFQIVGTKRMVLFPPSDVAALSFAPGASSSSIDVFSAIDAGGIANARPQEATVQPRDVLFIPPLWLHAAKPMSDMSIAVNIFFRDLESGYSTGRDVYGNRDLAAYEKGRQDIARISNSFNYLPAESRVFYLSRLAKELAQMSIL